MLTPIKEEDILPKLALKELLSEAKPIVEKILDQSVMNIIRQWYSDSEVEFLYLRNSPALTRINRTI